MIFDNSKTIYADSKMTYENSETIFDNSKTIYADSKMTCEDSKTTFDNSKTIYDEPKMTCDNSKMICCELKCLCKFHTLTENFDK